VVKTHAGEGKEGKGSAAPRLNFETVQRASGTGTARIADCTRSAEDVLRPSGDSPPSEPSAPEMKRKGNRPPFWLLGGRRKEARVAAQHLLGR